MSEKIIGKGLSRVEGPLKVTGKARYSAEIPAAKIAYAVPVGSSIASGKILSIDLSEAKKLPGVLAIVTHENRPQFGSPGTRITGGPTTEKRSPLQDGTILYAGQYIAVVVAESLQTAQHAGELIKVSYDEFAPVIDIKDSKKAVKFKPKPNMGNEIDKSRGDAAKALQEAAVKIDKVYSTEGQNHNQMEPHASTAIWDGDKLTVYDSTQYPAGVRNGLAGMFQIPETNVRVVSHFVGGGFGGKGNMWTHVPLAAMAARIVRRPVKLSLARHQMFTNVGRRSETHQRIAIGAERDGTLKALIHEGDSDTAMDSEFVEQFTISTPMLYKCENVSVSQNLIANNRILPTYMRAPGEATGVWVLESAMDELAHELKMDPIELRMKNYAYKDPEKGQEFSSKTLDKCYQVGAEKFGWSRRKHQGAGQTETARNSRLEVALKLANGGAAANGMGSGGSGAAATGGQLIGMGMATATRGAKSFPALASVRLNADGTFVFRSSTPEQGTGTPTVMAQIGAESVSVPMSKVVFEFGDTDYARAPIAAGSATVSSVGNAVWGAGKALQKELAKKLTTDPKSPFNGTKIEDLQFDNGALTSSAKPGPTLSYAQALKALNLDKLETKFNTDPSGKSEHSSHGFGAHFAEVSVDPELGLIRVNRIVSAITCGRVMNEKTCIAQVRGGVIWGLSMAMMEATIVDPRSGRVMNNGLSEYHIPVNLDIPPIEVYIIPEEDKHIGALGAKGVGEIGIAGVPAAIANAVFNATGKRLRRLPIRIEDLLLT